MYPEDYARLLLLLAILPFTRFYFSNKRRLKEEAKAREKYQYDDDETP